MPSPAFARPLWPATLRALRELTRLALASLVLAVGLGAAVAADPPARSAAVPPSNAAVAVGPLSTAAVAVRPAIEPRPTIDAGQGRQEPTASAPVGPRRGDAAPARATQVGHFIAPVRAGEPTRRGPPAG
ncbi:hypothetical protein [Micromonospora lutea]|uniref:Uncharacterized protein n=1 Tax=Micromonospora lutea TaxID=419825 RepID=A0ABQ4J039_9ACTN|nr:hypothetical protein [Micromonospora lutea]GIJ23527.1 hypothetical protein Vlu01_41510 [Micromonospora lutea]